ncbi:MAG TPA: formylglycine-generating enzyme family protein [Roseiflexaceae bacterium]|nr:formylglycine-generating enzyme family protein [Roseiflexaceae bacterium]
MTTDLQALLPPMIVVPSVPFLMGTPERELSGLAKAYGGTRESYREESPQQRLRLPAFEIGQMPVTNALYALFVAQTGARSPLPWRGPQPPADLLDYPVVDVGWEDARTFCRWLTEVAPPATRPRRGGLAGLLGLGGGQAPGYRLPSEAEWEHAARGLDGRTFPWGNEWDEGRANTRDGGPGGTTPIWGHAGGASPYGCLDMAGNVWEWTSSLDALYPYRPGDGREDPRAPGRRILRGGCYANPHGFARCACRFRLLPTVRNEFLGFRLARSTE